MKKQSRFFAMFSRMKYIDRWSLMRNARRENLSEHSLETAAIAHALAVIENVRFGGSLNAERAAVLGIYHDMPEIITGDMPTPIKHGYPEITRAYCLVEKQAGHSLEDMLPEDIRSCYHGVFSREEEDAYLWRLVKAADKISALIKCIEEDQAGNREFLSAKASTLKALEAMNLSCVAEFLSEFAESYGLTLDELQNNR